MAEKTEAPASASHNRFDASRLRPFIDRIDNLDAEIQRLKDDCAAEVDVVKGDRKQLLEDMETEFGVPVKAMKHFLGERKLRAKLAHYDDDADESLKFMADRLREAMGLKGTPLGDYAGD